VTRSDLVEYIAEQNQQYTKQDIESALSHILNIMSLALKEERRIEIRGFGSFSVVKRRAYIGRNPLTGASVPVPIKKNPRFKPSKALKNQLLIPL
jgi:integration host factor subunit beta